HEAVDLDGTPLALVHRDITPGNLLVGYDGVAKLADFGLAKSLLTEESNLTQHGEILGTPHYLAPEIIRGESASRLSDLYGLGAVMYRFLTGVAPHTGTTAEVLLKVLSEEPRALDELRPDLSPWLVTFVHSLLTKIPAQRPKDARALVAQLHLEAKASGLLVPRSAVGRWLSD
ncbi:MAG: serine/threonine-protein kinase, partial [Planctomycetota bacterium]